MISSTGRRVGVTAACVAVFTGGLATAAAAAPVPVPHVGARPGSPAAAHAAFVRTHPADGRVDPGHVGPHRSRRSSRIDPNDVSSDPAAVDLSAHDVPVADQGAIGSCVSWAITHAQMGWYANRAGRPADFAAMYSYSQVHLDNSPSGGGAYPSAVYDVAATQGIDVTSDYPQPVDDFTDLPTPAERAHAARHTIGGYDVLYIGQPGVGADGVIEDSLAAGDPVALLIQDYQDVDDVSAADGYVVTARDVIPSTFRGDHEVLAVGYDATGVVVQNSWGTGWGHRGYATLGWDFVEQHSLEATTMHGLAVPAPVPTPTPVEAAPSAITGFDAAASGTASIRAVWGPPADPGSSPVTGYVVTVNGTRTRIRITVRATARAATVAVTPGATYVVTVAAVNPAATGPAATATVTLARVLSTAPRSVGLAVNTRTRTGTLSFAPPKSTGGFAVTGYRVTGTHSRVLGRSATGTVFTGLAANSTASFTVAAVTSQGVGAPATVTAKVGR